MQPSHRSQNGSCGLGRIAWLCGGVRVYTQSVVAHAQSCRETWRWCDGRRALSRVLPPIYAAHAPGGADGGELAEEGLDVNVFVS